MEQQPGQPPVLKLTGDAEFDRSAQQVLKLTQKPGRKNNPFGIPDAGDPVSGVRGYDFGDRSKQSEEARLTRFILSKASAIRVFGQNLAGLTEGLVKGAVHHTLEHKTEIVTGGAAAFAAKTAVRAALAGSGGIVAAAAIGAAGGLVSGAVKEYIKQRRDIDIGETEKALIIGGLKNEFRRIKASDKRKIAVTGAKGAVFGAIGGVIGAEIHEGWSGVGQWIQEHGSNVTQTPTDAATSSALPSHAAPAMPEAQPAVPKPPAAVPSPAEAQPAVPKPPAVPEIKPLPESIKLPAGSNPWNEMQKYSTGLGRSLNPQEITHAANIAMSESGFSDAHNIPAGATLKLTGVNEYLEHLAGKPPMPTGAPDLQHVLPTPTVPAVPESIPLTEIHGHIVSGSVIDNNLTYDGKPWVLLDNGTKNIDYLFKAVGETGAVDKPALATKLQEATVLWAHGQLNPGAHEDLYRVFHLSNGTSSIYNNLLDDDTLESLKRLGIVRK